MCGICGLVVGVPGVFGAETLVKMRDTMTHRGPDDAGLEVLNDGRVGLAHRRLSILDLTQAGHQPMANEDGTIWLSYNGEIYNHAHLRNQLEARGHSFTSRTDTEVVVHLYEEHGADLVGHLRGIFAFAIWDDQRKRLLLARDRLGLKPMYYATTETGLVFASEIKALFASGMVKPRLDESRVPEYLTYGRVLPPNTLFKGVRKLEPGHVLEYASGEIPQIRRYWDVFDGVDRSWARDKSDQDLVAELRQSLDEAVDLRLMGDVPIGVFLSAGIDSGTVSALVARNASIPLRTFTVGFDGGHVHSESDEARALSDKLGAEHHDTIVGPSDVHSFFPKYLEFMEEPGSNPIWMAVYFVSCLARENGIIVALTGDGGDELFAGYDKWMRVLKLHRYGWKPFTRLPGPLRETIAGTGEHLARDRVLVDLFRAARAGEELFQGGIALRRGELQALVRPELLSQTAGCSPYEPIAHHKSRFIHSAPDPTDYADWMTYLSLKSGLLEDYLMRLDKMGMAASVEGRAPLLDQEFLRLAMSIPGKRKYAGWNRKKLLKGVAAGLLPRETINTPKRGFNAPVQAWIAGEFADTFAECLSDFGTRTGIFTKQGLRTLSGIASSGSGTAAASWGIMSLSLWYTHWIRP